MIFVLGVPRSGTTAVASLLGSHPLVTAPAEPWVMLMLESLGAVHALHPAGAGLIGRRAAKLLGGRESPSAVRRIADAMYSEIAGGAETKLLVDKTPRYHLIYERLYRVFPDARYVFVLRDPAAIAASMRRSWNSDVIDLAEKTPGHPLCVDFFVGLPRLAEATQAVPSGLAHIVRYEELLADPAGQARQLFDALDIKTSNDELAAALRLPQKSIDDEFGSQEIRNTSAILAREIPDGAHAPDEGWSRTVAAALGPAVMHALGYVATSPDASAASTRPEAALSGTSLRVCQALSSKIDLMLADQEAAEPHCENPASEFLELRQWLRARLKPPSETVSAMASLGLAPSYLAVASEAARHLDEKEAEIQLLATATREKENEIQLLATATREKENEIQLLATATREKENEIQLLATVASEKENEIQLLATAAREKEAEFLRQQAEASRLREEVRTKDSYLARLTSSPFSRLLTRLSYRFGKG